MAGNYKEYEKLNLPEIGRKSWTNGRLPMRSKKVWICGKETNLSFFTKVLPARMACLVFIM